MLMHVRLSFAVGRAVLAATLGLAALGCASRASAAPAGPLVPAEVLDRALAERVTKVAEFEYLREICMELKLRCWLFGGTAAGYSHYVKWDLFREKGDPRFQPDRFDYDYTNIFRSTQDADIVIDGSAEQAARIEERLKKRFPHFQGSKDLWEVRLLKADRGDKEALLNNPDFLNQHTDSNSTGMVEVTKPPEGESAVRDLRDWTPKAGERPRFFRDVHEGRLHYYFSHSHGTTRRFQKGLNPPILSVIRYLTKAYQYELEIRPEDLAVVRRIVGEFDPARDLENPYVRRWVEKNGKKLFQHAVNLEYAWNMTEELGLRRKLGGLGDPRVEDSLAWWMDKEPLRSRPVGEGTQKTARELFSEKQWTGAGDDLPLIVSHETRNFLAYESITRAHTGDPNVLISRSGKAGEAAAFGNGFYTRVGRVGAAGTGLTIRFSLDPKAREGTDFLLKADDFLVILNKNAVRVIPESLDLDIVAYFEYLTAPETAKLDPSDLGIFEKLRRRIGSKARTITPQQHEWITGLVAEYLHGNPRNAASVLSEYAKLPNDPSPKRNLYLQYLLRNLAEGAPAELKAAVTGWAREEKEPIQLLVRYLKDPRAAGDPGLSRIVKLLELTEGVLPREAPALVALPHLEPFKVDIQAAYLRSLFKGRYHRDERGVLLEALAHPEAKRMLGEALHADLDGMAREVVWSPYSEARIDAFSELVRKSGDPQAFVRMTAKLNMLHDDLNRLVLRPGVKEFLKGPEAIIQIEHGHFSRIGEILNHLSLVQPEAIPALLDAIMGHARPSAVLFGSPEELIDYLFKHDPPVANNSMLANLCANTALSLVECYKKHFKGGHRFPLPWASGAVWGKTAKAATAAELPLVTKQPVATARAAQAGSGAPGATRVYLDSRGAAFEDLTDTAQTFRYRPPGSAEMFEPQWRSGAVPPRFRKIVASPDGVGAIGIGSTGEVFHIIPPEAHGGEFSLEQIYGPGYGAQDLELVQDRVQVVTRGGSRTPLNNRGSAGPGCIAGAVGKWVQ